MKDILSLMFANKGGLYVKYLSNNIRTRVTSFLDEDFAQLSEGEWWIFKVQTAQENIPLKA